MIILDSPAGYAKLKAKWRRMHPPPGLNHAHSCCLSKLPRRFSGQREIRRQVGSLPEVQETNPNSLETATVTVHTPEAFAGGGRTATGKLAIKPVARKEVKVKSKTVAIVAGITLGIVLVAWLGGRFGLFGRWHIGIRVGRDRPVARFAAAGRHPVYLFTRRRVAPYRGTALYLARGVFARVRGAVGRVQLCCRGAVGRYDGSIGWIILAPPLFIIGTLVAATSLDLDMATLSSTTPFTCS